MALHQIGLGEGTVTRSLGDALSDPFPFRYQAKLMAKARRSNLNWNSIFRVSAAAPLGRVISQIGKSFLD